MPPGHVQRADPVVLGLPLGVVQDDGLVDGLLSRDAARDAAAELGQRALIGAQGPLHPRLEGRHPGRSGRRLRPGLCRISP